MEVSRCGRPSPGDGDRKGLVNSDSVSRSIPTDSMYHSAMHTFDLYSIDLSPHTKPLPNSPGTVGKPFIQFVALHGPQGEIVRLKALVDDGAMVNVMDEKVWRRVGHRLGSLRTSNRQLRMANGALTVSTGSWDGTVTVGGAEVQTSFEVLPSGGAWSFLFGKPLLVALEALHKYSADENYLAIETGGKQEILHNLLGRTKDTPALQKAGVNLALDVKSIIDVDSTIPREAALAVHVDRGASYIQKPREVQTNAWIDLNDIADTFVCPAPTSRCHSGSRERQRPDAHDVSMDYGRAWYGTFTRDESTPVVQQNEDGERDPCDDEMPVFAVLDNADESTGSVYTRHTDPFAPARVDAILKLVTIGDDLTAAQREEVIELIRANADCFALSVSEVTAVPDATFKLNIPDGAVFSTKVHQKPLTPPQKAYFHKKLNEMLEAGVVEPCSPSDVRCVSPITLAKKAHDQKGLSLAELQHRVNDLCVAAGLEPTPDLPPRPEAEELQAIPETEAKWRICMNFAQVNRVTQIAPMPQGDIRQKQLNLSNHRWISTVDFASGFYAVTVAEESRPYTAFYVEGRGYFWCVRMPFGLTGAPSAFAHLTATHLHDFTASGELELFVDDGATAGDDFQTEMDKLRRLLQRIRERKLSLSPSKSEFFVTTTVFAGGTVGPDGVTPDLAKLTAIVNWPQPIDALALASFIGVAGHYRDLIRGFAKIAQPLQDLLKEANPGKNTSKTEWRRRMRNFTLAHRWTDRHTTSFVTLKKILTSEPVLRRPVFDGTPFVVTTDGCKEGFGAVLAQRSSTVLANGRTVTKTHPIAYASKRTSRAEEKYKPFLLEFAALKYALDQFSDLIWGYPIEIKTDCSALRDVLTNEKLNSTLS